MIEKLKKIGGQEAINLNLRTLLRGIKFNPDVNTTHCFYEALILAVSIPRCLIIRDNPPDYILIGFSDANFRYFRDIFNSEKNRLELINSQPELLDLENFYYRRLDFYCEKVEAHRKGIPPSEVTSMVYERPLMNYKDIIKYNIDGNLKSKDSLLTSIMALKITEVDIDTHTRLLEA